MGYMCPLCNGMTTLYRICPSCGTRLDHKGRIEESYDPYSPYRDGEDLKRTNGYYDDLLHQCIHVGYCPYCNKEHLLFIQEELH
ncbi:conserved hypothetical protein [[Clostridium] ultunense Esp]|uniref:hypothetical protein n=1 Tax=Thermicanus aegyptius TaxID=94009 RepID=UPI0002B709BC|nr:hypothetical protein [Thermicanus aegyptius]CCQ97911.1 conserved hypothetical protein [[Clostridium] ultunense Esp]